MERRSIIFVCTGNACRSQMAEGLMRQMAGDRFDVFSAGSSPAGFVHPLAIEAMAEIGVDIASHTSKGIDAFGKRSFDYVVTVCDHAAQSCPTFRGRLKTLRWPLHDPVSSADEEDARAKTREVRETLRQKIREFLTEDEGAKP